LFYVMLKGGMGDTEELLANWTCHTMIGDLEETWVYNVEEIWTQNSLSKNHMIIDHGQQGWATCLNLFSFENCSVNLTRQVWNDKMQVCTPLSLAIIRIDVTQNSQNKLKWQNWVADAIIEFSTVWPTAWGGVILVKVGFPCVAEITGALKWTHQRLDY
jgi:hypothetical protein